MLVLDIGDHGDLRAQSQKHMTVFIGLNDEDITASQPAALRPVLPIFPPTMALGSKPARCNICAIMEVVVVLPCVPATAIVR